MLSLTGHALLPTGLADLVRADPFALDGPGAKAFVIDIVASEVTMLDQATTRVFAREVDDFKLAVCQWIPARYKLELAQGPRTWHMTAALWQIGEFLVRARYSP